MLPLLTFCVVRPLEYWDAPIQYAPLVESLATVARHAHMPYNLVWITSGQSVEFWQREPGLALAELRLPKPYVCLVKGMGSFAGAWVDSGFAMLGDVSLDALGEQGLPDWDNPYSRYPQLGAVRHELEHLLCRCVWIDYDRYWATWDWIFKWRWN